MLKPIIWYLVPWSRTIYIDLIIDYTFQEKWFIRYISLFCKTFYMYYLYDVLNLLSIMSMLYHFGKRPLSIVLLPQSLSTILLRLFNLILLRLNVQSRQFYLYANYFILWNTKNPSLSKSQIYLCSRSSDNLWLSLNYTLSKKAISRLKFPLLKLNLLYPLK